MSIQYTQAHRHLKATLSQVGTDKLLATAFTGREALSELFQFSLDLLADNTLINQIGLDKCIGSPISVEMTLADGKSTRPFHGMCLSISQEERDQFFTRFRLEMVPKVWLLTQVTRSRTFSQQSIPDILRKVLGGFTTQFELTASYPKRDFVVQYRESDWAFACRLMEEEGIFYYFRHAAGSHTLVLADAATTHKDVTGNKDIVFEDVLGGTRDDDRIETWSKTQEIRLAKVKLWDACFEMPGKNLEVVKKVVDSVKVGTVAHRLVASGADQLEFFDFPGGHAGRFDGIDPGGGERAGDLQHIFSDGNRLVQARMQANTAGAVVISGNGNCRRLQAGFRFNLVRHTDANGEYVLTSVTHRAKLSGDFRSGQMDEFAYSNTFTCLPSAVPYRPPQATPKPSIVGTQTATVTGPAGEEIFTDKYGRVKVIFPWDQDQKESCWIRVGTSWAGKQWGAIRLPRIGQEVIVTFLDGDPSQPLVVGSVYNADQMPPYKLPDHKTQSGVKSRSSLNGTPADFNEFRFEDKKGEEEVFLHAQKDQLIEVENDETHWVGHDRKKTIDHDETTEVKNDRTETVGHDETITIKNDRTETVQGNEKITVKKDRTKTVEQNETIKVTGNRKEQVVGNEVLKIDGNATVTIGKDVKLELTQGNNVLILNQGNESRKFKLGKTSTEAMQAIEMKVGANSIRIDQSGVTIKGIKVTIQAQAALDASGMMTTIKGGGMTTVKGAMVMIN